MNLSDQVRDLFHRQYISPARGERNRRIEVRVSDLNRQLGWTNRFPLICSALGARSFHGALGVNLIAVTDPCPSSTTVFSFQIIQPL